MTLCTSFSDLSPLFVFLHDLYRCSKKSSTEQLAARVLWHGYCNLLFFAIIPSVWCFRVFVCLVGLFWFGFFFFCSFYYSYSFWLSSLNLGVWFLLLPSPQRKVDVLDFILLQKEDTGPGNDIAHVRCWKKRVRFCCQEGFLAVVLEEDAY